MKSCNKGFKIKLFFAAIVLAAGMLAGMLSGPRVLAASTNRDVTLVVRKDGNTVTLTLKAARDIKDFGGFSFYVNAESSTFKTVNGSASTASGLNGTYNYDSDFNSAGGAIKASAGQILFSVQFAIQNTYVKGQAYAFSIRFTEAFDSDLNDYDWCTGSLQTVLQEERGGSSESEATSASTEPTTTEPTTESTEPPTTEPTTESTEPPTTEPTTESTEPPTTEPTTESTEPSTTEPTTESTEPSSTEPETTEETTESTAETSDSTEPSSEEFTSSSTETSSEEETVPSSFVPSETSSEEAQPGTGDSSHIYLYTTAAILSAALLSVLVFRKKKH